MSSARTGRHGALPAFRTMSQLGTVAHICIPSTWGQRQVDFCEFQDSQGYIQIETVTKAERLEKGDQLSAHEQGVYWAPCLLVCCGPNNS